MIGPLVGGHTVRVGGIEGEVVAPILQREATPTGHEACAEAHVVAVDEGAGVAVAVGHTEVHCVTAPEILPWCHGGQRSVTAIIVLSKNNTPEEVVSGLHWCFLLLV